MWIARGTVEILVTKHDLNSVFVQRVQLLSPENAAITSEPNLFPISTSSKLLKIVPMLSENKASFIKIHSDSVLAKKCPILCFVPRALRRGCFMDCGRHLLMWKWPLTPVHDLALLHRSRTHTENRTAGECWRFQFCRWNRRGSSHSAPWTLPETRRRPIGLLRDCLPRRKEQKSKCIGPFSLQRNWLLFSCCNLLKA